MNLTEGALGELLRWSGEEELPVEGRMFRGEDLGGAAVVAAELKGCKLVDCRLAGADLSRLQLEDCVLEGCDLSNAALAEAAVHRSLLRNCKLVGLNLGSAFLRDVEFVDCNGRYLAMNRGDCRRVVFRCCLLEGAAITECKLGAVLEDCDLSNATLFSTPLKGVDLSSCEIAGIRLTPAELRGAVVGAHQTAELARFLEVTVKF